MRFGQSVLHAKERSVFDARFGIYSYSVVGFAIKYYYPQLPTNLDTWRIPGNCQEAEEKIWTDLYRVFRDAGFTLWPNAFCSTLKTPGLIFPLSSGFGYATSSRRLTPENGPGTVGRLRRYDYSVRGIISRQSLANVTDRIPFLELPVQEMGTMLLFA